MWYSLGDQVGLWVNVEGDERLDELVSLGHLERVELGQGDLHRGRLLVKVSIRNYAMILGYSRQLGCRAPCTPWSQMTRTPLASS